MEKELATHSSIFAWEIPWTEEPVGLRSPWSPKESDTNEATEHAGAHAAEETGSGRTSMRDGDMFTLRPLGRGAAHTLASAGHRAVLEVERLPHPLEQRLV